MPVGKPTLNNAAIRHALRSLHADSGAAHAAKLYLLVAPSRLMGRGPVEHVALLTKILERALPALCHKIIRTSLREIIIITVMPGL